MCAATRVHRGNEAMTPPDVIFYLTNIPIFEKGKGGGQQRGRKRDTRKGALQQKLKIRTSGKEVI